MLGLLFFGVFAPLVSYNDPLEQRMEHRMEGPSLEFPLGTDHLGRCLLSRIIWGARRTLFVALGAGLVSIIIGTAPQIAIVASIAIAIGVFGFNLIG
ncbi:MAG: hypothetical protein NUW37_12155 [Planctomycetes bacterium]|nr:hypothetical protein [Planctomycetota bacterium]